ncbi:MAG: hypothetical protein ACI8TX_003774 [Hyphomicrobiaceae bacterium]|jgi:hypothetical protein
MFHLSKFPNAMFRLSTLWIGIWLLACMLKPNSLADEDERLQHWAWQALEDLGKDEGARSIDSLVRARLEARGLAMSPAADRRTLIRRLSFDLHGLPPSTEAVEAFVADNDPDAYAKLVDQMLAAPAFGERFAQHWLDIAHYADTHGFERDRRRPNAWHYRDYVIDAFNNDKPYDRFLQEQIAGDVLWPGDADAVIATGFLAAGPWDFVGQVETKSPLLRRAARTLDLDDMATQVMTATMAMTVNCARCHDHKLDPISQREYYQLTAVFVGVKRADRKFHAGESARLLAERTGLLKEINRLEPARDLADVVGGGDGTGNGEPDQGIDARTGKVETKRIGYLANIEPNRFVVSANPFIDGVVIPNGGEDVAVPLSSTGITTGDLPRNGGKAWDIIRNGPVNSQHSPKLGGIDFARAQDSLLGLHANAGISFALAKFRDEMGAGGLRFTAQLGYFGKESEQFYADAWVFIDGKKAAEFRKLKRADGLKNIDIPLPDGANFLTLISSDGGNGMSMDQVGFGNPVIRLSAAKLSEAERESLAKLRARVGEIDAEIGAMGSGQVYGIVPQGKMPEVRVMRRGDPEEEVGDPLAPGAVSALAMLGPELGDANSTESERRAALAAWITDPDNPLTPRVIVNRLWHWHFGQGIVDTPSDFGFGGGRPSHPELLDWLAAELQRSDWSLKKIHRRILLSDTYRQDSRYAEDAKGVKIDADNRLLWRQNLRRIEAETIRDSVLMVSGKINRARGGPGYENFTYREAYAPEYNYITADTPKLWKRSIYRYVVRTTPDQFLSTLDCPDPANFTPKRLTTTTPLQSLALYNNDFMLRQSRYLAERIELGVGTGAGEQVRHAFRLVFGRGSSPSELQLGTDLIEEQSLFALCRSLLNANEFIYVD